MTQTPTERLLALRTELLARRDRLAGHFQPSEDPAPRDEQQLQHQNDEVVDALARQTATELADIDTALQRLEEGTYGQCARCGEAIAAERLLAMPGAVRCVQCAELA